MSKRIKYPSIGGFNAGRGSIQALHPQSSIPGKTKIEYQKLTAWERANNRTRAQSMRLIRQNILLAQKYQGFWWVKVNPACEDMLEDL